MQSLVAVADVAAQWAVAVVGPGQNVAAALAGGGVALVERPH